MKMPSFKAGKKSESFLKSEGLLEALVELKFPSCQHTS
jgi:hypothetical protein